MAGVEPIPPSKEAVQQKLDKLNYHERAKWAASVGANKTEDPQLKGLVKSLRQHPAAPVPQYEAEEGFTEMLPTQQHNVAKFYHEDHFALVCAAAAKDLSVIQEELRSPSIHFKQLAAREYVRLQRNDEDLFNEIIASVPFVRTKLVHAAIEDRRTPVIDRLVDVYASEQGIEAAASILHGCSSAVIARYLKDSNYTVNRSIHFDIIARHHAHVFVDQLQASLERASPKNVDSAWSSWDGLLIRHVRSVLLRQHVIAKRIWDLALKFPAVSYLIEDSAESKVTHFPEWITSYLRSAFQRYPTDFLSFLRQNLLETQVPISYPYRRALRGGVHSYGDLHTDVATRISVVSIVLDKSTRQSFYVSFDGVPDAEALAATIKTFGWSPAVTGSGSAEWDLFQALQQSSFLSETSLDDITHLLSILVKWLDKVKAPPKSAAQTFVHLVQSLSSSLLFRINSILSHAENRAKETGKPVSGKIAQTYNAVIDNLFELVLPKAPAWHRAEILISGALHSLPKIASSVPLAQRIWRETIWPSLQSGIGASSSLEQELWDSRWRSALSPFDSFYLTHFGDEVVDALLTFYAPNPIGWSTGYYDYSWCEAEKQRLLAGITTHEYLKQLALTDTSELLEILQQMEFVPRIAAIKFLLEAEALNKPTREKVLSLQDIDDPKVRNALQKASDSNSAPERKAAIKALVKCTFKKPTATNVARTLTFLRKKLKNAGREQRAEGLAPLLYGVDVLGRDIVGEPVYEIWFSLLDDALQSQDLDESEKGKSGEEKDFASHSVLKHFAELSQLALVQGALRHDDALFNFGAEIQWRVVLFRKGDKRAARAFSLNFGNEGDLTPLAELFKDKTKTLHFVDIYLNAYSSRISEKHPTWVDDEAYYISLLNVIRERWVDVPVLGKFLGKALDTLRTTTAKDPDGLLIVGGDHPTVKLFSLVYKFHEKNWEQVPLLVEYIETMIRSRLAFQYIFMWMKKREGFAKTRKEKRQKRDDTVRTLLSITPSAIHLKFVQRHLIRWHQTLLDPFILAEKTFRGVFYIPPAEDKEEKPKPAVKARRKGRFARRAAGGRGARLVGRAKKPLGNKHELQVADELKAEKDLYADIVDGDHREFFCIDLCYQLRRLLPRQAEKLGQQWLRQVTNTGRALPSRTHAVIRYTLMPTTDYPDVVANIDKLDSLSQKSDRPIPVNIIEALLKGVMYTDEPCAPLHYLFAPKFLQSDRARISVHVAAKCGRYAKPGALTATLGGLFEGNRRKSLKVTTHKAIIRLLMSNPTEDIIKILLKEWKHKELHRDVRITLLQETMVLLKNKRIGHLAWNLLDTAVDTPNAEVQAAIVGSVFEDKSQLESLFQKRRLKKSLDSLRRLVVPVEHRERFARNVVWRLATTAKDDDVKNLAIAALGEWCKYGKLAVDAAALLSKIAIIDPADPLLASTRSSERELFHARWKVAVKALFRCCAIKKPSSFANANKDLVIDVIDSVVNIISTTTIENPRLYNIMKGNLEYLFDELPVNGPWWVYGPEFEDRLLVPFARLNGLFWTRLTKRKFDKLNFEAQYTTTYPDNKGRKLLVPIRSQADIAAEAKGIITDLLLTASENPARIKRAVAWIPELASTQLRTILGPWLIDFDNHDKKILPSLLININLQFLERVGYYSVPGDSLVPFFKRTLTVSPSYNLIPHSEVPTSLTKKIVSIIGQYCSVYQDTTTGRLRPQAASIVSQMLELFEDAAAFDGEAAAPEGETAGGSGSGGGGGSNTSGSTWLSGIWRRISSFGAEAEAVGQSQDDEDNAYTTLRLKIGYHILKTLPARVVDACPDKLCRILDNFLVTHCFEKGWSIIYDVFSKIADELTKAHYNTDTLIEAIVNLNLANIVLAPSRFGSGATVAPPATSDTAAADDDEMVEVPVAPVVPPIDPETGGEVDAEAEADDEEAASDDDNGDGEAGVGDDADIEGDDEGGEDDWVDDGGDDGDGDDAGDADGDDGGDGGDLEPFEETSKEELPAAAADEKFGDRYVNYSMLIALKLVVDKKPRFAYFRRSVFYKLAYWALSTSLTTPKLSLKAVTGSYYWGSQKTEINFDEILFSIVTSNVDPRLIIKKTNQLSDQAIGWAIDFVDFLLSNSFAKYNHPYVRQMTSAEIRSLSARMAVKILTHLLEKITSHIKTTKEKTKWVQEIRTRIVKLSSDPDPSIRKKAFKIEFPAENTRSEAKPKTDPGYGFGRGFRGGRGGRGGFGRARVVRRR